MAFGPSRKRSRPMVAKRRRRFARRVVRKVSPSIKRYVAKAINRSEETKYSAFTTTSQEVGPNGSTVLPSWAVLPNPSQGVGRAQRIGNTVHYTGLKFKGFFQWTNAYTVAGGMVRMIVGVLKQPISGTISAAQIESLLFANATNGGGDGTTAIRDKDGSVRVLYDRTLVSPNQALAWVSGGGNAQVRRKYFNINVNMKKSKMSYDDSSAMITGQIFLYICSNSTGATSDCLMSSSGRFYFKDA